MNDIKVFITGVGAPGAPGIIKSLRKVTERKITLYGGDANPDAVGKGMVDSFHVLPKSVDDYFIGEMLNICDIKWIDVVIPLVTKELPLFAQNVRCFEDIGTKVLVSKPEGLSTANDKFTLMCSSEVLGVPVPKFRIVNTTGEFIRAVFDLGYPNKTVCFKPPVSNGMRGFRIIDEGRDRLHSLLTEKPNNVYISLAEFIDMCKDKDFPQLLVMEYLGGEEYSVDILCDHGRFITAIPRTRDQIKMGISFVGTTVKDEEIINYSRTIVEGLNLHGNIGLQFRRDSNGVPKVIECNPRVQGTIVLCTASGYNMVYNAIKVALGEELPTPQIKWGTKMIRYWDEIYLDSDGSKVIF